MSFLKRLFGGKSPEQRIAAGEKFLQAGEPGMAKLELDAAVADPALPAELVAAAGTLLREARDRLAGQRLEEAGAWIEDGDLDQAQGALDTATELAVGDDTKAAVAALLERLGAAQDGAERKQRQRSPAPVVPQFEVEEPPAVPDTPEGDDELSDFEHAVLGLPDDEAERLTGLDAADPAVGEALAATARGDGHGSLSAWARVREPGASDPLVQREWARAHLVAGQAPAAAKLLAQAMQQRPTDAEAADLLLEAHVIAGDKDAAGQVARTILADGLVRDPAIPLTALVEAGLAEEASTWLDRALAGAGRHDLRLWSLQAAVCAHLGQADRCAQADSTALDLFRAQCQSCGPTPTFPVASARRQLESLQEVDGRGAQDRERVRELASLLAAHDPDNAARWQELAG